MNEPEYFLRLGLALALGMLIGLERGWKEREAADGSRVAGIRTYALLGLLGGTWALVAGHIGGVLLGFAFLAVAAVLIVAYGISSHHDGDVGITGLVAGLLTFVFGALAMTDYLALAAAGAVVTTILLGLKAPMHGWLMRIERRELLATFKLLGISVVILPLLPNEGYGPWQALNPFRIWWMVILIAGISFAGYIAVRVLGARAGLMLSGLFGGLASSTATTVAFARLARDCSAAYHARLLAGGILFACATMFPRILLISAILDYRLALALLPSLGAMSALTYAWGGWVWYRAGSSRRGDSPTTVVSNPMKLKPALVFGALLAGILVLSRALQSQFGESGLYALAAVAGLADADAVTLTVSDMAARDETTLGVAALSLLLAASVNTWVKAVLASAIGGRAVGVALAGALAAVPLIGLAIYWFGAA